MPSPSLPAKLTNARRTRALGLGLSGAFFVGGLGLALTQDLQLPTPQLPEWFPWFLAASPFAAAATLAAAKASMGDAMQLEMHNGRLYVQWGAPSEGPPLAPASIEVTSSPWPWNKQYHYTLMACVARMDNKL